jgi:hypothetical protein
VGQVDVVFILNGEMIGRGRMVLIPRRGDIIRIPTHRLRVMEVTWLVTGDGNDEAPSVELDVEVVQGR